MVLYTRCALLFFDSKFVNSISLTEGRRVLQSLSSVIENRVLHQKAILDIIFLLGTFLQVYPEHVEGLKVSRRKITRIDGFY